MIDAISRNKRPLLRAAGFLAPNVLGFLLFTAGPVLFSLVMAFTNWNLAEGIKLKFVGLENFTELARDPRFWSYFANTIYLMLGIPLSIAGSLGLALILHELKLAGNAVGRFVHAGGMLAATAVIAGAILATGGDDLRWVAGSVLLMGVIYALAVMLGIVVFRTLYYLPSFTSGVALFILWKALYNSEFGPINAILRLFFDGFGDMGGFNSFLQLFGIGPLSPPEWLSSVKNLAGLKPQEIGFQASHWGLGARDAIIIMGIVTSIGGNNMLLYLAGLTGISPELYEAANIDGASRWQRFAHITWPQLAPTTFFIMIMSVIGGLQGGFEVARVMTNGGPAGTTTTLSYYIYNKAFTEMELGYASAVAWFLFIITFVITLLNWKFGNRLQE